MGKYESRLDFDRWAGTAEDLVEAAEAAGAALREWEPEVDVATTIVVDLGESEATDLTTDEFRVLSKTYLSEVKSITLIVRSRSYDSTVRIWVSRRVPAIVGSVQGTEQARVRGLRDMLARVLQKGARWPGWDAYRLQNTLMVGSLVAYTVTLTILFTTNAQRRWLVVAAIVVISLNVAVLGFFGVRRLVVPPVELLPAGSNRRLQQSGRAIVALVVAFILALAAALIWSLLGVKAGS